MELTFNEGKKQWEWDGNVRDLVNVVGNGDARLGFVVDKKSGAKIAMNIDGVDEYGVDIEPFYIESPDGDNMYDAYNRKEAVKLLTNIRKGMKYPDLDTASLYPPKRKAKKSRGTRRDTSTRTGRVK